MEGEGLFCIYRYGCPVQGIGIEATEGVLGAFCEGLSGFFCVYEVFWKFLKIFQHP